MRSASLCDPVRERRRSPTIRAGTLLAQRFELVAPLERGGSSTVWEAVDHDVRPRRAAVKVIELDENDPVTRARFDREARIAGRLSGTGFPEVFACGFGAQCGFIAMELLEGETLSTRLKRRGRLSAFETLAVLRPVGLALARAHAEGVVHRDVKAQNIFFAREGDFESVVVLDLGIAKQPYLDPRLTAPGGVMGSPHWMSPEQSRGEDLDHRTDLWSLAVAAYLCLTGRMPFEGSPRDVIRGLRSEAPRSVSLHLRSMPVAVDVFFERALAKAPRDRFRSARALVEAFESVVVAVERPTSYRPPQPSSPFDEPTLPAALRRDPA